MNSVLTKWIFTAVLWAVSLTIPLQAKSEAVKKKWALDFIIIGAQKSGTTALYKFIKKHPKVLAPKKEVHFFDLQFDLGVGWYRNQFPKRPNSDYVIGEKTPYYLFHPLVPQRIHTLYPDVKIIMILRNPVDRAYSHYWFNVRRGVETLSFAEAIQSEPERLTGEMEKIVTIPFYNSFNYQNFSYLSRGIYIDQIQRWFSLFSREQVLILSSRDLKNNPDKVMQTVFEFLGLEAYIPPEGYAHPQSSYEPMDGELKTQLSHYFRPYNQELEELLGIEFRW